MDKMNELKEQEKKLNYRDIYEKDKLSTITEKDDNTKINTENYNDYIKNKLNESEEEENVNDYKEYENEEEIEQEEEAENNNNGSDDEEQYEADDTNEHNDYS
jgi:hypothetical protein